MDDKPLCHIEPRPGNWPAHRTEETAGSEPLWSVQYGRFITKTGSPAPMSMLLRDSVYQAVLSGRLKVAPESHYRRTLVLRDTRTNQFIHPAESGRIY